MRMKVFLYLLMLLLFGYSLIEAIIEAFALVFLSPMPHDSDNWIWNLLSIFALSGMILSLLYSICLLIKRMKECPRL